jgi:hypothetical protein
MRRTLLWLKVVRPQGIATWQISLAGLLEKLAMWTIGYAPPSSVIAHVR